MKAYLQISQVRADGTRDAFQTLEVPARVSELPWQKAGLTYTASGYGRRIPTQYLVQFNGKWRRVYCCIFSNIGTCYIGKLSDVGERITVSDVEE